MKKQQNIAKLLTDFGLEDKEVKIYLSLIKFGRASASQLAHDTDITRTYIYDIAEDLAQKGLLSILESQGVRYFEALNHSELVALINRKRDGLTELSKKVNEAISDFESLKLNTQQKTNIRFFSGAEGVLNIYDEINNDLRKLNQPYEIDTIFSPEKLEKTFPNFFATKKYIDAPMMTKRDIVNESKIFAEHLAEREKNNPGKYFYKIWPKEKGDFPADTLCWQNKIAFIELSEYPSGTIIENEAVTKTFKMWFENMWQNL